MALVFFLGACGDDGEGDMIDAGVADASTSIDVNLAIEGTIEASWTLEAACPVDANRIVMRVSDASGEVSAPGGPCSPAGALTSGKLPGGSYQVSLEVASTDNDLIYGLSDSQTVEIDEAMEMISFSFDPNNQGI